MEQELCCTGDKREHHKAWRLKRSSTLEWFPVYPQESGWRWLRRWCLFVTFVDLGGDIETFCLFLSAVFLCQSYFNEMVDMV